MLKKDEGLGRCAVQKNLLGIQPLNLQTISLLLADKAINLYKRFRYLDQGLFSQFMYSEWFERYRNKMSRAGDDSSLSRTHCRLVQRSSILVRV